MQKLNPYFGLTGRVLLAIMAGWQTRIIAILLAGFTLLTAFTFHLNFADQMESIMFMKNLSIAGGFLMLAAYGPGALALDNRSKSHGVAAGAA